MKKNKYYPNSWQEYKDSDDDFFYDHEFEDFMNWKVHGWQLPSSVCCIIRETDTKTKKVKEYVYSKPKYAVKKIHKLMDAGKEFSICDHSQVQQMYPHET